MHSNHRSDFELDAGVGVKFLTWPRFHRVEVQRLLSGVPDAVSGSASILNCVAINSRDSSEPSPLMTLFNFERLL